MTQAELTSPDGHAPAGLGLGLSLVKEYVELHGGSVQVRSQGLGRGSEFTVRLPLRRRAERFVYAATRGVEPSLARVLHAFAALEAMHMPTHRSVFVAVFLTSGLLAGAVTAQDTDCTTSLGSVEVRGNLNIAARCQLSGTEVNGNVTLFEGGSLIARNARIEGSIEGRRANFVDIDRSVIGGNLRLEELVGDSSTIQQTDIRSNATLSSNRSRLQILNNDFGGNLRATRNTGGLVISGNGIEGNLDCTGNSPEPTGLGNRVDGDTKGQCRNLGTGDAEDEPEDDPDDEETPPPPQPPPPSSPPRSSPPPTTVQPPATPSPPTASPAASAPPPTSAPPTSQPPSPAPPAASAPPAATPPAPVDTLAEDDGGAGAFGWPAAFLLPLLAWRRFAGRKKS